MEVQVLMNIMLYMCYIIRIIRFIEHKNCWFEYHILWNEKYILGDDYIYR